MAREVWCNETAAFDEGGALSVISVISIVQSNLQRTLIDLTISRHHCAIRYKTKTTVTQQMLFCRLIKCVLYDVYTL